MTVTTQRKHDSSCVAEISSFSNFDVFDIPVF